MYRAVFSFFWKNQSRPACHSFALSDYEIDVLIRIRHPTLDI